MRRIRLLAVLFAMFALFGACAADEDPTVGTPEETSEATDEATDEASDDEDGDATVAVSDSEHGEMLVDGEGRTLYLFTNDTEGESTCTGDCLETWPALTVDAEPVAGDGVDADLLGTTEREDGEMQVIYNDHPLYYFSGDEEAGDMKGQGVGDKWYVVSAEGEPIEE